MEEKEKGRGIVGTKMTKCRACGADIAKSAATCPRCGAKNKKGHPILTLFLILFILGAVAAAGQTGSPSKEELTLEKFNSVSTGMTYEEVVDIIGFEGELSSQVDLDMGQQYKTEIYTWANTNGSNMNATFQGGAVVSKAQFGLK